MARKNGPYANGDFIGMPNGATPQRRADHEEILCSAIRKRILVNLLYENDSFFRLFEPHVLYISGRKKILIRGNAIKDQNSVNSLGPHNFEVCRIKSINTTDISFSLTGEFNRHADTFKNGILCSV